MTGPRACRAFQVSASGFYMGSGGRRWSGCGQAPYPLSPRPAFRILAPSWESSFYYVDGQLSVWFLCTEVYRSNTCFCLCTISFPFGPGLLVMSKQSQCQVCTRCMSQLQSCLSVKTLRRFFMVPFSTLDWNSLLNRWDSISCNSDWLQTCDIAEASLEFVFVLPCPWEYWGKIQVSTTLEWRDLMIGSCLGLGASKSLALRTLSHNSFLKW